MFCACMFVIPKCNRNVHLYFEPISGFSDFTSSKPAIRLAKMITVMRKMDTKLAPISGLKIGML